MTGPKPYRPVQLPDLTVRGGQASPVEVALRMMGAPDDIRTIGQANFRTRRDAFHNDFPRAIPGGVTSGVGDFLSDVGSVNLPFLPPLLPQVKQEGMSLTQHLTNRLNEFFGAPEGTEGTQTGREIGQIGSAFLPYEAALPVMGGMARGIGREFAPMLDDVFTSLRNDIDPAFSHGAEANTRSVVTPVEIREHLAKVRAEQRRLDPTP